MNLRRGVARGAMLGVALALHAVSVSAQQSPALPPVPGQPPLLSSTPTPPPGAMSEPSQMSGMPLQVGDLPPGTVAIRLIRRTFAENVVNTAVELRAGAAAGGQRSVSDAQGRAVFTGLKVGDTVRARAVVDGEALESQSFQLPAQGGVRLVLVAGVGAGVPAGAEPVAAVAAATAAPGPSAVSAPPAAVPGAAPVGAGTSPAVRLAALLVIAFAVGGGTWWYRRPLPADSPSRSAAVRLAASPAESAESRSGLRVSAAPSTTPAPDPTSTAVPADREQLFRELVALERMHEDGDVTGEEHQRRRELLIAAIVALDARLQPAQGA